MRRNDLSKISLKDLHNLLSDLEVHTLTVGKKINEVETIDGEIEERKKKWRDFLLKTEAKEKLIKELMSLIPLLREKYERMAKSFNFCTNSLNGFFLVNDKISENEFYETNEIPCIDREQRKQQIGELGDKLSQYEPEVNRLESYDNKKLKNTDPSEIEQLIQQATEIIKNLDEDNHNFEEIMNYLREERKDFKDGDIYANQRRIERQIATSDERLQAIINEFEIIKDTLDNSDVSNARLKNRMKEIESNIVFAGETLDKAKAAFDEASRDIDKEDMHTAKLATLAYIIEKLGSAAKELNELIKIFESTDSIFKELQTELVDLYYAKKLSDLINVIKMLLERLRKLSELIDKLIQLAHEFEGYTSDNEEEEFVNDLEGELADVKRHHTEGEEELLILEKEIVQLQDDLSANPPRVDDEKAEKVSIAIDDLSKMIENIERLVDSKIQRFADMDPYKKFRRREKELNKLRNILTDKEDILLELKHECKDDLKNSDASDELKEVAREVLEDVESLEENLDNLKKRMSILGNEIESYIKKSEKTEMTIEEIFELLYTNVEVKKKLKVFLSGIDEFYKLLTEYRKKYLIKKAESPPKKTYKAAKGDQVDEMLGQWINTHG
jgi:DNA repair exonuclease SbcCD ATPase subunit